MRYFASLALSALLLFCPSCVEEDPDRETTYSSADEATDKEPFEKGALALKATYTGEGRVDSERVIWFRITDDPFIMGSVVFEYSGHMISTGETRIISNIPVEEVYVSLFFDKNGNSENGTPNEGVPYQIYRDKSLKTLPATSIKLENNKTVAIEIRFGDSQTHPPEETDRTLTVNLSYTGKEEVSDTTPIYLIATDNKSLPNPFLSKSIFSNFREGQMVFEHLHCNPCQIYAFLDKNGTYHPEHDLGNLPSSSPYELYENREWWEIPKEISFEEETSTSSEIDISFDDSRISKNLDIERTVEVSVKYIGEIDVSEELPVFLFLTDAGMIIKGEQSFTEIKSVSEKEGTVTFENVTCKDNLCYLGAVIDKHKTGLKKGPSGGEPYIFYKGKSIDDLPLKLSDTIETKDGETISVSLLFDDKFKFPVKKNLSVTIGFDEKLGDLAAIVDPTHPIFILVADTLEEQSSLFSTYEQVTALDENLKAHVEFDNLFCNPCQLMAFFDNTGTYQGGEPPIGAPLAIFKNRDFNENFDQIHLDSTDEAELTFQRRYRFPDTAVSKQVKVKVNYTGKGKIGIDNPIYVFLFSYDSEEQGYSSKVRLTENGETATFNHVACGSVGCKLVYALVAGFDSWLGDLPPDGTPYEFFNDRCLADSTGADTLPLSNEDIDSFEVSFDDSCIFKAPQE